MYISLPKALLSFITLIQCQAAVTWTTFGCDGWAYEGVGIDEIWDNARLLASNANSQISNIPTSLIGMTKKNAKNIGANAHLLFGIKFGKTGTDREGSRTLEAVRSVYSDVQRGLDRTLIGDNNFDLNHAYLFCEGNGLTQGPFPGSPGGASLWHAEIKTGDTTEYNVLTFAAGATTPKPCSENGKNSYLGKTFTATKYTPNSVLGQAPIQTSFTAIILCPSTFSRQDLGKPQEMMPALNQDLAIPGDSAASDDYTSLAGTILHEMVHVVGKSRGAFAWTDQGGAFDECVTLATTEQDVALRNPDNYRIFAEMCMSPTTKWTA